MTESDHIVAETAARIFADLADPQTINRARDTSWKDKLWRGLTEAGLTLAWVPEKHGGAGANLADGFGLNTGIATAMVDYPIGELIAERVKAMGVKPFYKQFKHNGVNGPNMATVYSDRGLGVRGPVVFYNRANEAGGMLKPGDFDWDAIFGQGVRWFHSGGIFAALSATTRAIRW